MCNMTTRKCVRSFPAHAFVYLLQLGVSHVRAFFYFCTYVQFFSFYTYVCILEIFFHTSIFHVYFTGGV